MAIKGNRNIKGGANSSSSTVPKEKVMKQLSKEEAIFIASKIQQANFKGVEFETYQQIMLKLKSIVDNG